MIKAPYNFVPLNKKVVVPHWGKHISHDIPFRDGVSGSIQVKITAKSPIFVRDGAPKPQSEDDPRPPNWFSQFENQPFIPGSSLRGMIRSVVEIMSFGKMKGRVNDHRYAIRDLSPAAKSIYLDKFKLGEVQCGWLYRASDESYFIEDCGEPGRISHRSLDASFGTDFATFFSEHGLFDQGKDSQKSAQFKYSKFSGNELNHHFEFLKQDAGRNIYEVNPTDEGEPGHIIFTGQPSPRKKKNEKWTGHHLEFIFKEYENPNTIPVHRNVMDNFFFAYHEGDKNRWSIDYAHWRRQLMAGEKIPVFFRKDKNGEILDLGLSYLYKLPYKNSIEEVIHQNTQKETIDVADAIFGCILNEGDRNNEESLKGRVHVSHAFMESGEADTEKIEVLSSPKASYYPNYVRQNVNTDGKVKSKYSTYMDDDASIAGWKRYPVHRSGVQHNPRPEGTLEKIETSFVPLKCGATFSCTIRFHNLQAVELGALLSALTFHGDEAAFHSLGMAKPLGYGKVKLDVNLEGGELESEKHYLKQFEAYMRANIGKWQATEQIGELFTMAREQQNRGRSELSYMKLEGFRKAKKDNEALDKYSRILGLSKEDCGVKTLLANEEDVRKMKQWMEEEQALYQDKGSPEEALRNYKDRQYQKLKDALQQFKAEQIQAIEKRKTEVQNAEKEALKEEKAAKARQSPPDWDGIALDKRKAFDELKKAIQTYVEAYYGEKYNRLVKDKNEGILPEEHWQSFTEKILTLASEGHKTEQKQLSRTPYEKNSYFKKMKEWVGEEQAEELWKKITG